MTLREVTRTVIGLVENVSGCSLVVSEKNSSGFTHCAVREQNFT